MAGKIGPALSGFAAFAGISVAIGDVVRTSMEFEKSLSSLKSLTGVTTQELSFLKMRLSVWAVPPRRLHLRW